MTPDQKRQAAFAQELNKMMDRFSAEWNLTRLEAVGMLFYAATMIVVAPQEEEEETT